MPTEVLTRLDSKSTTGAPLFMVHPIEGAVTALAKVAAELQTPVYGLQCTSDVPMDSMVSMAKFYVKQIQTVQPSGPYMILGYSFGCGVAFEIAVLLEAAGEKVSLICLDGSPMYVHEHTSESIFKIKVCPYFNFFISAKYTKRNEVKEETQDADAFTYFASLLRPTKASEVNIYNFFLTFFIIIFVK